MAWTNTQKQIAARACKAAGVGEAQRRDMILRHFANAHATDGRITSTAPKLNNADFEQFMCIVEGYAGGRLLHFTAGYWTRCARDHWARMRHRAVGVAAKLEAAGKLAPGGVGLAGWIAKRVTRGAADRVEQLDYHGLLALILSLEAYARQEGVNLNQTDRQSEGTRICQHANATD